MTALKKYCRSAGLFCACVGILLLSAGCSRDTSGQLHGYVEGEFVYVSAQLPGTVNLQVSRGVRVKQGQPLFAVESVAEMTARDEAGRRLAQARSVLQDLHKGQRPTEMASLQARLQQARAGLSLVENEWSRQEKLFGSGVVSAQDLDRARSARDQQRQLVAALLAELQTAALGGRSDQIAAAEANVRALESVVARSEWELSRTSQSAPAAGLVYDTLYRSGEYVAAGRPVVTLLPPQNIKVRVFVPETQLGSIHIGDPVTVTVDGVKESIGGRVSYLSPKAEYTPPVIYSRESRAKLVFMAEVTFPEESAIRLHPGQPVDLRFGK